MTAEDKLQILNKWLDGWIECRVYNQKQFDFTKYSIFELGIYPNIKMLNWPSFDKFYKIVTSAH
jgi:hypothetical protein